MLKINSKLILLTIIILSASLRLLKINTVPTSLFGDELDLGYHAYSILKTGRDYQGNFMPIHFHSLAEWRTPLYLYSAVPTVAVFGITPLGVRLPAVFFGVLGVWGIFLLTKELMVNSQLLIVNKSKSVINHQPLAIVTAFLLAFSPWHLQYSRAGFEVTMLLTFLIFGLYFFFRSIRENGKYLWFSMALITFTPWIYSTAKLFTPLLMLFLFFTWKKEIFKLTRSDLVKAILTCLIVGLPISYSTIFGGGAQRASYTSVFTDPTVEPEVGVMRERDAKMEGNLQLGHQPSFEERFFHNKLVFWYGNISKNILQSTSSDFLFREGDLNLRHSPNGVGQFHAIEIVGLILGVIFLFAGKVDFRTKLLIAFWILVGILPASLTRDGGNHATRLILILPPLIILIAYGLFTVIGRLKGYLRYLFLLVYFSLFVFNVVTYFHNYYKHYPWDSERWWHAGFKESFGLIKEIESDYDKVIISMSGEPVWIFFAGYLEYPPREWQLNFPINNKKNLENFGEVSYIGKYYFSTLPEKVGIYGLDKIIDDKTLYLAVAKEIGANLILEPGRTPPGLNLLKAVSYPSGEPAYYLFSKK